MSEVYGRLDDNMARGMALAGEDPEAPPSDARTEWQLAARSVERRGPADWPAPAQRDGGELADAAAGDEVVRGLFSVGSLRTGTLPAAILALILLMVMLRLSTVLLFATLFRLALNVASTRVVLVSEHCEGEQADREVAADQEGSERLDHLPRRRSPLNPGHHQHDRGDEGRRPRVGGVGALHA